MNLGALRALEFDRVIDEVRGFALTPLGSARLAHLTPSPDPAVVAQKLAATSEAVACLVKLGVFPLRASAEIEQILRGLAIEGRALEPLRLLELAGFLESVEQTRSAIRQMAAAFPLLDRASGGAASFKYEIAQTRDRIDSSGDVVDHASPELRNIRDRLRKQRSRLRGTLESYLRGKDTAKYLQDQVVSERNGRYVIIVKAEHRSSIPGIVHGASTSGASLFLEPLSTVEINNDIVALEEQQAQEVHRILLATTDAFRSRGGELMRTVEAATELDALQACARYSQSIDGSEPQLSRDGALELLAARHPLLKNAVPVTIKVIPPSTVLLVTGPNTGGKTVALKTAGLLSLMAQSGLRIPVSDGSRVPVFRSMFADIGDEQSIEASLSTFSSHVMNIISMDRALQTPALVLLDEVGSGTDPVEGAALGVGIIEHFRRRGATVLATSHYDALKTYASTTDGVASAAFGFDTETFAPSYQLIYGSPGRSLALEIAARLGLNPSIIAAARQSVSAREAQLAEHLAKLDQDIRALEHDRRLVAREQQTLEEAGTRLSEREAALRNREDTARRRLAEEMEQQIRQARREIDQVVEALKAKTKAIERDATERGVTTGDLGVARGEARSALDVVVRRVFEPAPPAATPPARAAAVGDRVVLAGLGFEGVVTAIHDGSAEVDVRGKRMRASVQDLRVVGGPVPAAPARVVVHTDLQPRDNSTIDLNVIGCSVDEAIARAERFLDESLLTDHHVIRLIHGYGTGQLKRALAGFLQQHPLVARFNAAPPEQGGGGVTVVELKD